jgi:hypothetical protein
MCTAKYRPVLLSERVPYMKKQVHVRLKNMNGWPDTKMNLPTDSRSQIKLHSTPFTFSEVEIGTLWWRSKHTVSTFRVHMQAKCGSTAAINSADGSSTVL